MALFRVRGRAEPGRNNSPEALLRALCLEQLGLHTVPSGRFDGLHNECTAHSDLWEIDSSDVESPSVKKAIANHEAHEDRERADLGYDSSWF